jgi:hypothetical protein
MRYKWIQHEQQTLRDVEVLDDGSLHNPNGYPDDLVREAVAAANERRHQRRSRAAKKAAETRRRRTKQRVYDELVAEVAEGGDELEAHTVDTPRGRTIVAPSGFWAHIPDPDDDA